MSKKTDTRDWIETVKRCPEFKKDIEEAFNLILKDDKGSRAYNDRLIKKWRLFGFEIYHYREELADKVEEIDKIKFANGVIELAKRKSRGEIYSIRTYERPALDTVGDHEWFRIRRELNATNEDSGLPFIAVEGSGVFATLRLDLNRTDEELIVAFDNLVKTWRKEVSKKGEKKERARKPKFDKWRIFDECEERGINPSQKAKEIYLNNGGDPTVDLNPPYNPAVRRIYDKVLDAYNNAKSHIEKVENEIKRAG